MAVCCSWHDQGVKMIPPMNRADGERLRQECAERFDLDPDSIRLVHAPYRLCPLGAHIDHQLGTVSGLATGQGVLIAFAPLDEPVLRLASEGFRGEVSIPLGSPHRRAQDWADYARGAAHVLSRHYPLGKGAALLASGPIAEAGLSSSAAIGLGYLSVLAAVNNLELDSVSLVELDRQIENDFMSLKNGILDPAAIAFATKGALSVIDCGDLSYRSVHPVRPFSFIAVFSGLKEALASSGKFNDRVEECLMAGGALRKLAGDDDVRQPLGNSSLDEYREFGPRLEPVLRRRAEHFFTECARVEDGAECYERSDFEAFGALMTASCLSSINNYETGSPELIALFETLADATGSYGARFCGAGFRGCCVALVDADQQESILEHVRSRYVAAYPAFENDVWAISTSGDEGLRIL